MYKVIIPFSSLLQSEGTAVELLANLRDDEEKLLRTLMGKELRDKIVFWGKPKGDTDAKLYMTNKLQFLEWSGQNRGQNIEDYINR